jgi:LDH2 family malate/lactate/ureidoglycolate dehydrogenase
MVIMALAFLSGVGPCKRPSLWQIAAVLVLLQRETAIILAWPATYLLQAVKAGYFAFVFTNASKAMPPWGGREGLLGTSPFGAAAPAGKLPPFVLDMSPAVAARGKIRLAEKRGEPIPEGYALDENGQVTT